MTATNDIGARPDAEGRFGFGRNWARFLEVLNDERIGRARDSLRDMLGRDDLAGSTFLDVGSGSGLFSLAARMLGASVRSFDYDPHSVACTEALRRRYFPDDPEWMVARGDALDPAFMDSLGTFDVVYSWGVLHHTGDLWRGIGHAADRVAPGGVLFLAIYNDQGAMSRAWTALKRTYNRLPPFLRPIYTLLVMGPREVADGVAALFRGRFPEFRRRWTDAGGSSVRGMSRARDIVDWIGGYPFEVASREAVLGFLAARGFQSVRVRSVEKGSGCNEFVLRRTPAP